MIRCFFIAIDFTHCVNLPIITRCVKFYFYDIIQVMQPRSHAEVGAEGRKQKAEVGAEGRKQKAEV